MVEEKTEGIEVLVSIPIPNLGSALTQQGSLTIPNDPKGIILFAHGSGSSWNSPRNRVVARSLNKDGLATLLVDLLTAEEQESDTIVETRLNRIPGLILNKFNINLLTSRLVSITEWVTQNQSTKGLLIGYFGASTGAAAALIASSTGSASNL